MKVIVITGCSSGFGYATAKLFGNNGWRVYAGVRTQKQQIELENKELLNVIPVVCDVTHEMQIKSTVETVVRKEGRIDVLVNNAGKMLLGAVEDFEIGKIEEQLNVNFIGMVRMTQAVLPHMRERGNGLIINISSINGLVSFPLYSIYSASKYAMETVSEILRTEVAKFGIRVVLVEPGTFETGIWDKKDVQLKDNSPYEGLTGPFLKKLEKKHQWAQKRWVARWFAANKVADLLWKIVNEEKPKLRYVIGLDAHLYYWGRRLLPFGVWQWMLRKVYGW